MSEKPTYEELEKSVLELEGILTGNSSAGGIFMTTFFIVIAFPLAVLPAGILCYFLSKRIRGGRGFDGWKRLLAWSFILPGLPFVIILLAMLMNQILYYDAGKPILSTIILAPATFILGILVSVLYLVSVPEGDKTVPGFAGLLVNLGCLSLGIYLYFGGISMG